MASSRAQHLRWDHFTTSVLGVVFQQLILFSLENKSQKFGSQCSFTVNILVNSKWISQDSIYWVSSFINNDSIRDMLLPFQLPTVLVRSCRSCWYRPHHHWLKTTWTQATPCLILRLWSFLTLWYLLYCMAPPSLWYCSTRACSLRHRCSCWLLTFRILVSFHSTRAQTDVRFDNGRFCKLFGFKEKRETFHTWEQIGNRSTEFFAWYHVV